MGALEVMSAYERAERLLREFLTEREKGELRQYGYVSVTGGSSHRVYRVYNNGQLVSFDTVTGRPIARCIYPRTLDGEHVPQPDVVLAFKLALENHEREMLGVMDHEGRRWP